MFSVYQQTQPTPEYTLKLVQLPPSIVAYLKDAPGKALEFKAPRSLKTSLVLCTDSDTYTVRQMNHSNTQLIVNDMAVNTHGTTLLPVAGPPPEKPLVALANASYIYELTETAGQVDTEGLPVYSSAEDLANASLSVADVLENSPIAPRAFDAAWHAIGGCEVDGRAVLLAADLTTDILYVIISVCVAEKMTHFTLEELALAVGKHNETYTRQMVESVAQRFGNNDAGTLSLDSKKAVTWFGIETLRTQRAPLTDLEMMLAWKLALPPFYAAPLDLQYLRGHYFRPAVGRLRYLRAGALLSDLHTRIKDMFQTAGEWDYDEFLPYVAGFIPPTKKPDAVLLKYARKRRVGKKFVVCPR